MICAMTVKERNNPDIITPSRARRIAKGSAHKPEEVNQLVKQFQMMRKMVGQMGKQGMFDMPKGGMPPGMDMGMLGGNPFGGGMPGMGNPFGAPPPRGHGGPGSFMPKGKMRRR